VNIIHQTDAVGVLMALLQQPSWKHQHYHAAAPQHPARRDFYVAAAQLSGLVPPVFSEISGGPFKIVSPARLVHDTGYVFVHPDPMAMLHNAAAW